MTLLAAGVAGYALVGVAIGIEKLLPAMAYHVPERLAFAATHFAVGGFVLLIGPFQFLPRFRTRWPVLHRWLGRLYVAGCLFSGVAGFMLAQNTNAGPVARTGFTLLAIFWVITTSMAFLKARNQQFADHRRWMIRSYALTFAAVTLRFYLPVSLMGFGIDFAIAYPAISFACWVPNAIVAEWMIRR
jgi:uncharacterized membrane protein